MDRERGSISSNGGRVIELNKEVLYADAIVARVTERIKAVPVVVVSGLTNERDALSPRLVPLPTLPVGKTTLIA